MEFVRVARGKNIMTIFENKIITVDCMPCIVLVDNTLSHSRSGPQRPVDKKDFTQIQREKKQMFINELLEEIKRHGWNFY